MPRNTAPKESIQGNTVVAKHHQADGISSTAVTATEVDAGEVLLTWFLSFSSSLLVPLKGTYKSGGLDDRSLETSFADTRGPMLEAAAAAVVAGVHGRISRYCVSLLEGNQKHKRKKMFPSCLSCSVTHSCGSMMGEEEGALLFFVVIAVPGRP